MGSRHKYTEEQLEFIKKHHAHMSPTELGKHCGVGYTVMVNELKTLGLSVTRGGGPYSDYEVSQLRELAARNKTAAQIADAIGRSEQSVLQKARDLGIPLVGTARRWTLTDMDLLRRSWGREPLSRLANEFKRSQSAVIAQARKMKLPPCYLQSEDIPLAEFCRDTGISRFRVTQTLAVKYDFPIKTMKPGSKRIYMYVDIEKIVPWLESHQSLYSAAGIPQFYFGDEPEWLVIKRRKDMEFETETIDSRFKADHWEPDEVAKLRDLVNYGVSYQDIADRLHRTLSSVLHKVQREGLQYTAPQYWRGIEFRAIRLGAKDKTDAEIGREIGRSEGSVSAHRRTMGINRKELNKRNRNIAKRYVKRHWLEMSDKELAKKLGRSVRSVCDLRLEQGLRRDQQCACEKAGD